MDIHNPIYERMDDIIGIDFNEKVDAYIDIGKKWSVNKTLPKDIVDSILAMDIPTRSHQDRMYLKNSKNEWFSTASVLETVININNRQSCKFD